MATKFYILSICILLLLLSIRFFFFYSNQFQYYDDQHITFDITLLDEPSIVGNYQVIYARPNGKQAVRVFLPRYPAFHYGDKIRISGKLINKAPGNKRAVVTMFSSNFEAIKNDGNNTDFSPNFLLAVSVFLRQNIVSFFINSLPQIPASLLLGIVFGVKEQMPKEFVGALQSTGVLHIVAASGMNVTMLGGFVSSIGIVVLNRRFALLVTIVSIGFYALLSGFSASIVRASIMGGIVFCAQILGRQYMAYYALALTGFAMLFFSPHLLFDIGFQLSFLSTLGLLHIKPILEKNIFKGVLNKFYIGEDITTTIAAQLSTLPILLLHFGTYSIWSVFANAMVLWTIPFLMLGGGIAAIFGMIVPFLGKGLLFLLLPLLLYVEKSITFFAGFGGVIIFNETPWQFAVTYYACLVAVIVFLKQRKIG